MCSLHDSLFDKHFISFDEDGDLLVSSISKKDKEILQLSITNKIHINQKMEKYMYNHKEIVRNLDK